MPTKRFITGAACPSCQVVDQVTLLREASYQELECMACGYNQKMKTLDTSNFLYNSE